MIKIFHNPRCKKSRKGLEYLRSKTGEFELIEYLKTGLREEDIKEILLKSNLPPEELVRKQEELFKKELKGRGFTREEWIRIICDSPKLLQRPFVVSQHKAVLADPPENIDQIVIP